MKRTIALAAMSGLLLVTAASCGSDEESSPAATEAEAAEGAGDGTAAPAAGEDTGTEATEAATPVASDLSDLTIPDISIPDISMPDLSDITMPDLSDISLPEGLSEECTAYAEAILGAMNSMGGTTLFDPEPIAAAFDALEGMVPDDLTYDVQIISAAYGDLFAVLAEYDYDFTKVLSDPEAMAKLDAMETPEVTEAQSNLDAYFAETCPEMENM